MSSTNEILNQSDFEALRLYAPDSMLHLEISAKLREIFTKLFQNTDINLDDFYFTGFDSDDANAFFIDASKTKNGKNVVAVSFGLIMALSNTQELAAITGHEAGHYIWSQLIGGRNTIFQERAADLRSVDLMINAGYNPRNVLSAQKKVFGKLDYKSVTLDVHGNSFNRIEDVQAYLTKLSLERGYFPDVTTNDLEYDAFKQKLQEIRKKEPYLSFIESLLQKKFKTTDIKQIPRDDIISTIFIELADLEHEDLLQNETRIKELVSLFKTFDFESKEHKRWEIMDLHLIIKILVEDGIAKKYPKIEPYLWQIVYYSKLPFFEVFNDLYFSTATMIENNKPKAIIDAAEQIITNAAYIPLANHSPDFSKYIYEFRPTPDIIGTQPFWVRLKQMNNPIVDKALDLVTQSPMRLVVYNEDDYLYDEHGNITAYGEEKDKIVQQQQDIENTATAKALFEEKSTEQINTLSEYEKIKDFVNGKIAPKDVDYDFVMKTFREWIWMPDLPSLTKNGFYLESKYIDRLDRNKLINLYNTIVSSSYYQDYKQYAEISGDITARNNIANTPQKIPDNMENTKIEKLIRNLSGKTMRQYITCNTVCDAYIKMGQYYHQIHAFKNEDTLYTYLLTTRFGDLKETQEYMSEKIAYYISKNPYMGPKFGKFLVLATIADIDKNKHDILENIIKCLGFKRLPKTEEELSFFITQMQAYIQHYRGPDVSDSPLCDFNPFFHYGDDEYPLFNASKIGIALLANYLASGYKCNPVKIIRLFDVDPDSIEYYKNIFAKLITHQMFDSFELDDKIFLYEFMERNNLFSADAANKNYFIQAIVNGIINYPDYETAVKYAESILMRKNILHHPSARKQTDIEFAIEREKLLEFYSDYWAKKLGRDDNSPEFAARATELAEFLKYKPTIATDTAIGGRLRRAKNIPNFSHQIASILADKVAVKIYAQENVTKILDSVNDRVIKGGDAEFLDYFGRGAEVLFSRLAATPDVALATIDFINSELTDESIKNLLSQTSAHDDKNQPILNKQSLTIIHENFWAADLPVRAYIMNRLLNAYSTKSDDKLTLILNMFFAPGSEYYDDAKLVLSCVYKNLDDIERNLVLAALIASGKKSGKNEMTAGTAVGRGLKMFLQNKGPAFIKFGQLLSYLPNLDSDIRHELSTLRDKAKIPTRAELFEILKTSLPESEYNKISYIGQILGAGSFFITVQIKYQGKDCVVSLMRPHTQKLTQDGINMIAKTVQDMTDADSKFGVLTNIITQARDSAYSEIDIEQDHNKYKNAVKIYESLTVHTPMGDYSPDVARWLAYGSDPDKNNAYKIMEMSPGAPLTSDELTEQERYDMALAYTTLELGILLSGNKWDTDRHAGQQNFANKDFREFCIGIFDTGAQMNAAPNRQDKRMMGYLLYLLITGVHRGKQISEILTSSVQDIDKFGKKFGLSTAYIDGVQRGLTALADIIQYQKEIRDDNGNIIQYAKSLSAQDLENIALAIMESGIVDRTLMNTTRAHFILDMLAFWKNKTRVPILHEDKPNPISITVGREITTEIHTNVINKAVSELEKMQSEKQAQEHLGVKIGLTEKEPAPLHNPNDHGYAA